MKDEIKEILDYCNKYINDKYMQYSEPMLNAKSLKLLLDYITNLQEKVKVSQTNEETYRLEMQDITKILGLDEHTTFDEVKEYATNLQEENERLNNIINETIKDIEHSTLLLEEEQVKLKDTPFGKRILEKLKELKNK